MREKTVSGTYLIQGESVWLLHRTKHDWYELPGGKLDAGEAKDPSNPTLDELRAVAVREMAEETTGYTHGPLTYIRKIEVMRSPDVHLKSHQWAAKVTRGSVQIQ
ncbi:MAG TPA: NUDIX hydrolase, partial [Acidobacteriota bacterium]|nr:NUDIX hydrolase [Acidobacteriota bacterium]